MFSSILHTIAAALIAPIILITGFFHSPSIESTPVDDQAGAALPEAVASFETTLAAPITAAATTMSLAANLVRGGSTLSGFNCFTVDEGSSQAEFICGFVSGTSVTSLTRGISPATGTTTASSLQFAHRRGASVKITDFPVLQILKAQASGQETYENPLSYSNSLATTSFVSSSHIVNKAYVDSVAFNGAGVVSATEAARGVSELATGAEIAASTATGTSGVLVVPASLATSTYNSATAANRVVVTGTNGTIDDDFLPRTIAATTTFTGTTTFSGPLVGNVNVLAFIADGTWIKPANLKYIHVRAWGGGGSGGSENGGNEASGGGGGGFVEAFFSSTTLAATSSIFVDIGDGGAAVTGTGVNGNPGGNTRFSSLFTAFGGGAGVGSNGAINAGGGGGGGALGAGGNGSGSTAGTAGDSFASAGGTGAAALSAYQGAGGGGVINNSTAFAGGNSTWGGAGGGGASGAGASTGATSTAYQGGNGGAGNIAATGNAGSGALPGGGGGAKAGAAGSSGAGGGGMVIVYEYF
jgi:hypothetical protein